MKPRKVVAQFLKENPSGPEFEIVRDFLRAIEHGREFELARLYELPYELFEALLGLLLGWRTRRYAEKLAPYIGVDALPGDAPPAKSGTAKKSG